MGSTRRGHQAGFQSRDTVRIREWPDQGRYRDKVIVNPYTYTKWDAGSAQWKGGAGPDAPGGQSA